MRLVISENNLNKTFYENVSKSPLFYLEGLKLSVSQRIMQIPFTNKEQRGQILEAKNRNPAVTFVINTKPCLLRLFVPSQNHWVLRAFSVPD